MTQEEVRSSVRKFIVETILFDDRISLHNDQSLRNSGVIDSTGILEIISFLEDLCNTRFKNSELVPENFDTISRISEFMTEKLQREKAGNHVAE